MKDPNDIDIDGEKAMQGELKVLPPTQLPQLSIQAVPFIVLLQSVGKLVVENVSITDQEERINGVPVQNAFNCQIYVVSEINPCSWWLEESPGIPCLNDHTAAPKILYLSL